MVWYSHLFQNFPQFIVIDTVRDFGIVNKAEIDVFLELFFFSMIQQMLAIWSLIPLPFLKPALTFGSSWPGGSDGKESACNAGDLASIPGLERSSRRKAWQPTPVFLPWESHGQRSLGYSPRGCKELDTTERLTLFLSLFQFIYSRPSIWSHERALHRSRIKCSLYIVLSKESPSMSLLSQL